MKSNEKVKLAVLLAAIMSSANVTGNASSGSAVLNSINNNLTGSNIREDLISPRAVSADSVKIASAGQTTIMQDDFKITSMKLGDDGKSVGIGASSPIQSSVNTIANSGFSLISGPTIKGDMVADGSGSTVNLNGGNIDGNVITKNGGTVKVSEGGSPNITKDIKNGEDGETSEPKSTFENKGSVTVGGNVTNNGIFKNGDETTESPAGRAKLTLSSGKLDNKGTFNNQGLLDIGQAESEESDEDRLNNSGTFTNGEKGTVTTHGGKNTNSGTFTNSGGFNGTTSKFDNQEKGNLTNSGNFKAGTMTNKGEITNNAKDGNHFEADSLDNQAGGKVKNQDGADMTVFGELQNLTKDGESGSEDDGITNSGNLKAGKVTNGGNITNKNNGNITVESTAGHSGGDSSLTNNNKGSITNEDGGTITVKGQTTNSSSGKDGKGGIKNQGTFNAEGGLENQNGGKIVNSGENGNIQVGTDGAEPKGSFTNAGEVDNQGKWTTNGETKNSGTLKNSGTYNAKGKVTNDTEGSIDNSGSFLAEDDVENKGSLNNSSTFSVGKNFTNSGTGDDKGVTNSGSFSILGDTFTNSGDFTNTGYDGNLTLQGALRNETGGNLKNTSGANVEITGDITNNNGSITNDTGSSFSVSGNVSNSGSGNITNKSKKAGDDGGMSIMGSLTNNGGTVTNDGGTLGVTGALTNQNNGKIDNKAGGTFEAGSVTNNSGTITNDGASTFNAKGKVTNENSGKIDNKNGSTFTAEDEVDNSGTITNDGTGSTFDAKKKVTNKDNGNINNTNDATFNAENGLDNQTGAKVTNSGSVEVGNGSGEEPALNNQGEIDNQSSWTTNGKTNNSGTLDNSGTYNANGKVTNEESGTLDNSGSFFATNDVDNKGKLNNSSTFGVEGTFTNSGKGSGKGVTNSGIFSVNGDSFTNSGDFTNTGEDGQLTVQNALKNETGGNLTNQNGAQVSVSGNSTNKGTITNTGDGTEFEAAGFTNGGEGGNGTITNSAGASFSITDELKNETGSNIINEGEGSIFTASSTVNNNGTITNKTKKSGEKGGMSLGTVTNNGTINNEGGSLEASTLTNGSTDGGGKEGKVTNNNGGDINVNGELKNQKGSITNSGSGSTFNTKGKVTNGAEGGSPEDASITNSNGAAFNAEDEVENLGTITNDGTGSTFNAKGKVDNKKGKIDNKGGANFKADGGLTNENSGSTVTNDKTSTFSVGTEDSNAELQNSGNIDNKGFWTTNGETKNSGTLDNSGTYNATGKVTNDESGTLENSGSFSATNEVENSGNLNNSSTFGVGGNFTNSATGDDKGVTNSGTFSVNGETFTNKGNFTNTGDDGQLTVQNALRNETGGNLTNKDGANVEIGSVENNAGSITNEANSIFGVTGDVTNSGSGTITNKSKKDGDNGGMSIGGNLTNTSGNVTNSGTLDVAGNVENNGKITNEADSDMTFNGEVTGGSSGGGSEVNIDNKGNLTLNGDASGYSGTFTQENEDSVVNVGSKDNRNAQFFGGDSTVKNGTVNWWSNTKGAKSKLKMEDGTLNLEEGSFFEFESGGEIDEQVDLHIKDGSTLDIGDGATLTLDGEDEWNGTIEIGDGESDGGELVGDGIKNGGNSVLKQSGGKSTFKNGSDITISGDSELTGGEVTLEDNSRLTFDEGRGSEANAKFTVKSGSTLSSKNGAIDNSNFKDLTVDDHANFDVDLDPRHHHGDQFTFEDLKQATEGGKSKLNISEFDFVGGAPIDRYIKFQIFDPTKMGEGAAEKFEFDATDELKKTPIGWYGLRADGREGREGWYEAYLARFNPQVFRGQVATLAMYSNQLHVDDIVTNHFILHDETLIDKSKNLNKYSAVAPLYSPYQRTYKEGGLWSKSYADIEKFNLTRGLNVRNDSYGTLLGADLPAVELNKDWTFIPTGYVGYNGARQSFEGVKMSQNGGQIGVMGTFIRNEDFITSVTAYGGGYTNEMQVEGFTDEPANWFAGASAKTAYNFEPVRDFILQPNLFMAYNAFGSRKWGTDYGVMDMNSGMLNAANVAPGLNMILSKETWSIYGTLQYMFFINDRVYGKAGNVELPDVRFEHGFIQYGIGATKTFKDTVAAYGQMNLRNGGITGIGFQLGLQWLFDMKNPFAKHEKAKTTQVDTPHVKKYIQPKQTADNKYMVKKTVRT